jgi:hypothetical protein
MFRLPESHLQGVSQYFTSYLKITCSYVTPPEDGFLEAETYVGVFKRFKET